MKWSLHLVDAGQCLLRITETALLHADPEMSFVLPTLMPVITPLLWGALILAVPEAAAPSVGGSLAEPHSPLER